MGLSLKPLGRKIVDVFSADTEEDQRKRVAAGQPRLYADQQRAMGNNRPATNPGAAFLGQSARLANTGKGLAGGAYGLGKIGLSSVFGDDDSHKKTVTGVAETLKRDLSPNSGLFGAGTFFDSPEEAANISTTDLIKKTVAGAAGVAGETLPVGRGIPLAKQGLKAVPRLAAEGGAIGAIGSAGDQFIRTGEIDPRNVALSAAAGGVLAAAPPLVAAGAKKLPRVTAKNSAASREATRPRQVRVEPNVPGPTDVDFRLRFKENARALGKRDPKLMEARLQSSQNASNDPVDLAIQSLANSSDPAFISRTLQGLAPKMQGNRLKRLTQEIRDLSHPQDVAEVLFGATNPKSAGLPVPRGRGGVRPYDDLQTQIEVAHNAGNKELEAKLTAQLPDQGMNPNARLSPERRAEIMERAGLPTATAKAEAPKLRVTEKYSPDRAIRAVTGKVEEGANKVIYNASVSKNPITRGTARLIQGISREAGATENLRAARRKFRGTAEIGKVEGADLAQSGRELAPDSRTRVWATIDTDQAAKMGQTVDPATLTPEEQALRERVLASIEETTKGNFDRGLITPEQANNPDYLKRAYEPFEGTTNKKVEEATRTGLLKQFRGRKEVSDDLVQQAITDPAYLAGKKAAQSHQAWAIVDYANFLDQNGFTFPSGAAGMVQLPDSKLYGSAAGKWVPKNISDDFTGFQYTNSVLNAFNDIITAYDSLKIRQWKKQMLTVFNPAVRLGNQISNRMFAVLNGHNPIEYEALFQKTKGMIKNRDPLYLEAVQQGLTNSDITRADFAKNIAAYIDDPEILKSTGNWFQRTYSQADDRAKLASYAIHRSKGYSPEESARLTQRGFQDYSSVGFFYDMATKLPFIGNAFVRFAGDSLRIGKNAVLDHPLRAASLVATWATFTNAMSKASGETPEDRKTREDRFGAPKLPFSDVSLTVQTPWGEVNIARFLPFYELNDIGSPGTRFLPIQTGLTTDDETKAIAGGLNPQAFQDPLLGQVVQAFGDKDFRGKSIRDPENIEYAKGVKKRPELSQDERSANLRRFLFNQNVPYGRELDAIRSAKENKPDIYGKERSLPQALLRAGGVKVEQYGPEQAQKTRDINKFFEGNVERVKQFIKENPDLKDAYYTFNNPTRDRKTDKKISPLVSPERWRVVNADQSGRLFGFLKSEAMAANKEDGRPVDPVYNLPTREQERLVLELRSRPSGDDIEAEEILRATQKWYTDFEKTEGAYYTDNAKYWEGKGLGGDTQNARVKEYGELYNKMYPKQSDLVQQYYKLKEKDPDKAKEFYKTNADSLSSDFSEYRKQRLDYINAKRKIEGYPPISANAFNNVTFGYEDDERKVYNQLKYGYGDSFGFGGGKKKGKKTAGSEYKYAVSSTAGGQSAKPKVTVKGTGGVRSTVKRAAQPKVSMQKSRV
jgi:hypothetical protein